jgi:hypothetical protein
MGQPLGMIHPRWPRVVTSRSRTSPSSVIRNGKAPYWHRMLFSLEAIVADRQIQPAF